MIFTVIVTYNGIKWIEKCVDSVINDSNVVIVDNGSVDGTVQILERYKNITLIKLDKNVGFGVANNIGISHALKSGAEFIFLLNQDAFIENDGIIKMYEIAKENSDFQVFSPIHLNYDGSEIDKSFLLLAPRNFLGALALGEPCIMESGFINAAAWFVNKTVFERIGGFNPVFFMYGEDVEFYNRLRFHNMKMSVISQVKIFHDSNNNYYKSKTLGSPEYYRAFKSQMLLEIFNLNNYNIFKSLKLSLYLLRKALIHFVLFEFFKSTVYAKKLLIVIQNPVYFKVKSLKKPDRHFLSK